MKTLLLAALPFAALVVSTPATAQFAQVNDPAPGYSSLLGADYSAAEREMLRDHVTDENAPSVRASVDRVLNALWEILSGVCHRHAIAC